MAFSSSLRSLTAAAVPLVALLGCHGSGEDRALTPVPPAAPPASSAPSSAGAAPSAPSRPSKPPAASSASSASPNPVPPGVDPRKTIAVVNGTPISAEKAYSVYRMNKEALEKRGRVLSGTDDQMLKAQSLEVVLAEELLYQAAKAKGVTVPGSEIDAAMKQLKQRVGSDEAYAKFVSESGLTESDVHKEIERNMVAEAYRKTLVAGKGVSEEQAKKFYEANAPKGMFNVPEQVHVQYILVKANQTDSESVRSDAKKRAEEAAKRAARGEDFGALAKQYSQDPTAARGGDIGLVPRGVMFPKFEEVAFTTKPGDVSPVFETPKGYNVIKIVEKKPESRRTYDEVKSALMADMGRLIEQDALKAKIQELASAAKIEVLDKSFAPPAPPGPPVAAAPPVVKP